MHRFILGMVYVAVAAIAVADEPKADAKQAAIAKALESFSGTWEIVKVSPDGSGDAERIQSAGGPKIPRTLGTRPLRMKRKAPRRPNLLRHRQRVGADHNPMHVEMRALPADLV